MIKVININSFIEHIIMITKMTLFKYKYEYLIALSIVTIYYLNNEYKMIIFILSISIFKIILNIFKYSYKKLFGLAIYPNIICMYNKNIDNAILYDFVYYHELCHLNQFKNKLTNFNDLNALEKEADEYSFNLLQYKYTKDELEYVYNYLKK